MTFKNSFSFPLIIAVSLILLSCKSGFNKSPVDDIVKDIPNDQIFSIILYDMDQKGNFSTTYFHKYQIIRELEGDASEILTDWKEVSKRDFTSNIDNMGMEIVARDSTGTLSKEVAPPGYNNYVGNSKYGQWENRGGSSFWAFYGQYAFMSSMFRMSMFPVQRPYYNDWNRNYRGRGRTYYGPAGTGGRYYGTGSGYSRINNPNSSWTSSRNNSFKNRVAGRTSRSSGRTRGSRSRGGGSGK